MSAKAPPAKRAESQSAGELSPRKEGVAEADGQVYRRAQEVGLLGFGGFLALRRPDG